MDGSSLLSALHVLIVDDCPDTAATLALLLKAWGHQASTARTGPEALERAAMNPPDVVLLDIGLPGMNGWDVARRLRCLPGMERSYLIAVSGYGQERDRAQSADSGCLLHLLKPVDPAMLEQ